jgi:hypothetical protein
MTDPDFFIIMHGHDGDFTHGFGIFTDEEEAQRYLTEKQEGHDEDTCDKHIIPVRAVRSFIVRVMTAEDYEEYLAELLRVPSNKGRQN